MSDSLGSEEMLPSGNIPILPMRSTALLPGTVTAVQMAYAPNLAAIEANPAEDVDVVFVHLPVEDERPDPKLLERIGVRSRILDRIRLPEGQVQITIQTLARVQVEEARFEAGYYQASIRPLAEVPVEQEVADLRIARILTLVDALTTQGKRVPAEIPRLLRLNLEDAGEFSDRAASLLRLRNPELDALVQEVRVAERLHFLQASLESIWAQIQSSADQTPRSPDQRPTPEEIRQKIRGLEIELGEVSAAEREYVALMRRVDSAHLPSRVAASARTDVERIRLLPQVSDEAADARRHLEALLDMPWERTSEAAVSDISEISRVMNQEFMGLEDAKRALLELLSVSSLRGDMKSQIPCLVGPPKVGKHALVAAVARAMGRPVVSVALGNRSEEDLVGRSSRRPQGKMGRLVGAFRESGVRDPVIMLEELDRLGTGKVNGDPVEVMEAFLQAHAEHEGYTDSYLDAPLDISDAVLFATARDFYEIPAKIRDRFVEVRLSGYTPEEKVAVVRERLLPRYAAEMGLEANAIQVEDETLLFLTRSYARDPGMAILRRSLRALLRRCALQRATEGVDQWTLTPEWIEEVLGPPRFPSTPAEAEPELGVVTGLAWTASGGELLFVEALRMTGSGGLSFTGLLGDVMQESIHAAFSYVRSQAERLNIPFERFQQSDLHVHFPGGAIPKDGPSAGAAVTLAIASVLSGWPVRHDVALTGEMTLRGKILDIGGVKEKVLAAYRAGIREVVLPKGNGRDLRDVPELVRAEMTFHLVERMDEIFPLVLIDPSQKAVREGEVPTRAGVDETGGIFLWQPEGAVFLTPDQAERLVVQLPRLAEIARSNAPVAPEGAESPENPSGGEGGEEQEAEPLPTPVATRPVRKRAAKTPRVRKGSTPPKG